MKERFVKAIVWGAGTAIGKRVARNIMDSISEYCGDFLVNQAAKGDEAYVWVCDKFGIDYHKAATDKVVISFHG